MTAVQQSADQASFGEVLRRVSRDDAGVVTGAEPGIGISTHDRWQQLKATIVETPACADRRAYDALLEDEALERVLTPELVTDVLAQAPAQMGWGAGEAVTLVDAVIECVKGLADIHDRFA